MGLVAGCTPLRHSHPRPTFPPFPLFRAEGLASTSDQIHAPSEGTRLVGRMQSMERPGNWCPPFRWGPGVRASNAQGLFVILPTNSKLGRLHSSLWSARPGSAHAIAHWAEASSSCIEKRPRSRPKKWKEKTKNPLKKKKKLLFNRLGRAAETTDKWTGGWLFWLLSEA